MAKKKTFKQPQPNFGRTVRREIYRRVVQLHEMMQAKDLGEDYDALVVELKSVTCAKATELTCMLRDYPDEEQWIGGNLFEMREETLATLEQKRIEGTLISDS